MTTSRQVLGAIGLLSQVEEPRGLLKLVVTLKASSKEGLVGHQLDSGSASAKRRLLGALVAEAGKVNDRQFNGSPVSLPEAVQVTRLDGLLEVRRSDPQVGVDVLTLQVDKLRMLVFVGLLEKSVVSRK